MFWMPPVKTNALCHLQTDTNKRLYALVEKHFLGIKVYFEQFSAVLQTMESCIWIAQGQSPQ